MTKTQKAKANCKELFAQIEGCQVDSYGNYKFGKNLRVKFNNTSWRFERKAYGRWLKYSGRYCVKTDQLAINEVAEAIGHLTNRGY